MLCLTLQKNERCGIGPYAIVNCGRQPACIGFDAPRDVPVLRASAKRKEPKAMCFETDTASTINTILLAACSRLLACYTSAALDDPTITVRLAAERDAPAIEQARSAVAQATGAR